METLKADQQTVMSKSEIRKTNKPLVEKRRRERINSCLDELKTLVLQALQRDTPEHSKLEKADILELTVSHLKSLQRHQTADAIQTNENTLSKYKTGFGECATEISRYLQSAPGVEGHVQQKIMSHLGSCMRQMHAAESPVSPPQQQQQQQHPLAQVRIQIPTSTPASLLPGNSIPALTLVQNHATTSSDVTNTAVMMPCAAVSVENQRLVYANVTSQPYGLYFIGESKPYAAAPLMNTNSPKSTVSVSDVAPVAHRQSNVSSKIKTVRGTTVQRIRPVWRPWSMH